MHDMYKALMKKKSDKEVMDPKEKSAKEDLLQQIMDMASDHMGHEMKKVTVASPDKEGLKMGLDKAKELVSAHGEGNDDLEDSEDEAMEEAHEGDETHGADKGMKHGGDAVAAMMGKHSEEQEPHENDNEEDEDDIDDSEADAHHVTPEAHGAHDGSAEKLLSGQIEHEASEGDLSDEEIDELMELLHEKKRSKAGK